ncbi:MAG: hypothetical protein ACI364_03535, partial [Coriobacteriales bacterium]
ILVHAEPDSIERIADELEMLAESDDYCSDSDLRAMARRLRRQGHNVFLPQDVVPAAEADRQKAMRRCMQVMLACDEVDALRGKDSGGEGR